MRVQITKKEQWTPDYKDNLQLPEGERMKIDLKFLTSERQKELQKVEVQVKFLPDGSQEKVAKYETDDSAIVLETVDKIQNFTVVDENGHEVTIMTGDDVLKTEGLSNLVDKIVNKVITNNAVSLKN